MLADREGLHVHLDCVPLGGGGYQTMIERALAYRRRGLAKGAYKGSFLFVDGDRAMSGQDWTVDQLRRATAANRIKLCCQWPNLEGLLLRMLPGRRETAVMNPASLSARLGAVWPDYRKPVDAQTLERKYSLKSLKRVAGSEPELLEFLRTIGFSDFP